MSENFPGPSVEDDAPDVIISAVDVVRSIIQPQDSYADERPSLWTIQGAPATDIDGKPSFRLFGDLAVYENGWFVSVTSMVAFEFRRDAKLSFDGWTPDLLNAYTLRLGGWASHVLYDVAAACARRLSAQSFMPGPGIPLLTPQAEFALAEVKTEQGDEVPPLGQ